MSTCFYLSIKRCSVSVSNHIIVHSTACLEEIRGGKQNPLSRGRVQIWFTALMMTVLNGVSCVSLVPPPLVQQNTDSAPSSGHWQRHREGGRTWRDEGRQEKDGGAQNQKEQQGNETPQSSSSLTPFTLCMRRYSKANKSTIQVIWKYWSPPKSDSFFERVVWT